MTTQLNVLSTNIQLHQYPFLHLIFDRTLTSKK